MSRIYRLIQVTFITIILIGIFISYANAKIQYILISKYQDNSDSDIDFIELTLQGDHEGKLTYRKWENLISLSGYYDNFKFYTSRYATDRYKYSWGSLYDDRYQGFLSSRFYEDNFYISTYLYDRKDNDRNSMYLKKENDDIYGYFQKNNQRIIDVDIQRENSSLDADILIDNVDISFQKDPYGYCTANLRKGDFTYLNMPSTKTFDTFEAHYQDIDLILDTYKHATFNKGRNIASYLIEDDSVNVNLDWNNMLFQAQKGNDSFMGEVDIDGVTGSLQYRKQDGSHNITGHITNDPYRIIFYTPDYFRQRYRRFPAKLSGLSGYYDNLRFYTSRHATDRYKYIWGSLYDDRYRGFLSSRFYEDNFYISTYLYDRNDNARNSVYLKKENDDIYGYFQKNNQRIIDVDIQGENRAVNASLHYDDGLALLGSYNKQDRMGSIEADYKGKKFTGNYYLDSGFRMDFSGKDNFLNVDYNDNNDTVTVKGIFSDIDIAFEKDENGYYSGHIAEDGFDYVRLLPSKDFGNIQFNFDDVKVIMDDYLQGSVRKRDDYLIYNFSGDFSKLDCLWGDFTAFAQRNEGDASIRFGIDDFLLEGFINQSNGGIKGEIGDLTFNITGKGDIFKILLESDDINRDLKNYNWNEELNIDIDYKDWGFDLWTAYKPFKFSSTYLNKDWNAKLSWDEGVHIDAKYKEDARLVIDTGLPRKNSLALNTAFLNSKRMQADFSGTQVKWSGPLLGLYSETDKYIIESRAHKGENIVSRAQKKFEEIEDNFELRKAVDIANSLQNDLEESLDATIYINPRQLKRHIRFEEHELNRLLYLVALDNKEVSVEAEDVIDLAEGSIKFDVSTDKVYALIEDWLQQPVDVILEKHEKNLIYGMVNTLAGVETGIINEGEFNLNSSLYAESAFRVGNFYTINGNKMGNGEILNFYNGTGILNLKVPLFSNNGDTLVSAEAIADVIALHFVKNVVELDAMNIGLEQLYYMFSFDDDVHLSIEKRNDNKWPELGFSKNSFSILFKNDKGYYLPGCMGGIIIAHPENKYFFRTRVIPFLPLDKDEEDKPLLKWQTSEDNKLPLAAVDLAYDTVFGINRKIFDRNVLLRFHRDVNNNNSFLQRFEIFPLITIGSETQFADKWRFQNQMYFTDLKFANFKSHLFLEESLERAVFTRGADIGYDFSKFDVELSYKQKEWDNYGDIEKIEDNIEISFSKEDELKVFSGVSFNYILAMYSYFAGFKSILNQETSANLSAGMEYKDYSEEKPEINVRIKLSFNF